MTPMIPRFTSPPFDSRAEVIFGINITLSAHPVLANIFLRVRIRSIHNSTTPRADALHP